MVQGYKIERCRKREPEFIDRFIRDIRPEDSRELSVITGDFRQELTESLENSEDAFKVTEPDGTPLVLFGNFPQENGRLIWCVGTKAMRRHERSFTRVSRKIILRWAEMYWRLYNCVACFNDPSIRWLTWLGAEFTQPFSVNGELFMRFEIRRK